MSYGVLASKAGHVYVATVQGDRRTRTDESLARFHGAWGTRWSAGRLALTKLHLTFIAANANGGVGRAELALVDVTAVLDHGGRVTRTAEVRTSGHALHLRITAGAGFVEALTAAVARAHEVPAPGTIRRG